MCGIAGILQFAPAATPDQALLRRMTELLAHRGPDDAGYETVGPAALGHRRLSIIDISNGGHQPMANDDGSIVIAYNGECYNYRELAQRMRARGHNFRSTSDTEVILRLYEEKGEACFAELQGMFALAIWDGRRRRLVLARDRLGIKPLYVTYNRERLLFASEMKALLADPQTGTEIDRVALGDYLHLLSIPDPRSIFQGIRKLQPGHLIIADASGVQERPYWTLPVAIDEGMSYEAAVAGFEQRFFDAVSSHMVADVPVGAFLSGGVDSSALCHFAAKRRGSDLQCFTIELGGTKLEQEGMEEDLHFARRMAERLHVPLEVVHVTPQLAHDLPRMLFTLDEPQADAAPLNALYISQRAREMGIKVLLSGAGGDDVFSGYRRHYALTREPLWSWLPQPARHMLAAVGAHLPPSSQLMRRVGKAFTYADLDARQRLISYLYWIKPQQSLALFNPELRASLATRKVAEVMESALASGTAGSNPLNQMLYLEQKFFLIDHNFNYTDKTSMAAGVEVRVPFLDPDLVAFANRLPPKWKQHGADGKWILKQALESILPHDVLYRAKTGFGVPLRFWLQGPLRPLLEDILSETSIKARGIFDMKAVRDLMKADREGRMDATYTIFSLLCIEIWARQFIDPPAPQAGV